MLSQSLPYLALVADNKGINCLAANSVALQLNLIQSAAFLIAMQKRLHASTGDATALDAEVAQRRQTRDTRLTQRRQAAVADRVVVKHERHERCRACQAFCKRASA